MRKNYHPRINGITCVKRQSSCCMVLDFHRILDISLFDCLAFLAQKRDRREALPLGEGENQLATDISVGLEILSLLSRGRPNTLLKINFSPISSELLEESEGRKWYFSTFTLVTWSKVFASPLLPHPIGQSVEISLRQPSHLDHHHHANTQEGKCMRISGEERPGFQGLEAHLGLPPLGHNTRPPKQSNSFRALSAKKNGIQLFLSLPWLKA